MTLSKVAAAGALVALVLPASLAAQSVSRVETESQNLGLLPIASHGRVQADGHGSFVRQWPGTYFETAFRGTSAMFRLGPGNVSLRIRVDGGRAIPLVKPEPGLYRVAALTAAKHRLRIDVVSEDAKPSIFGGFYSSGRVTPAPIMHRARQIEFIGDSHTVGYGNTSTKRECTDEEVWATTDTSQGIAPRLARRYNADYQVNAISGRGIVRNYNGFLAPTLPAAYPYVLFDQKELYADPKWRPQLIVIGLGTNDFSTPLNAQDKWKARAELQHDFEESYVRFVKSLRRRNSGAFFLLWIADNQNGEVTQEVAKVAERLRRSGETRLGFVAVRGLELSACNYHPNLADDERTAEAVARFVDAHPRVWRKH